MASLCSCASTQRGWLSAWHLAHMASGRPWQGDGDPILAGVRKGTYKLQTPRHPRKRINARMVKQLLKIAMQRGWMWWCVILILTYHFLLRMPSELFQQYDRRLLHTHRGKFCYGPIRRKQRQDWCTVVSFCYCANDSSLCLHTWLPLLDALESEGRHHLLGGYHPQRWTAELRELLQALGVRDAGAWHGHDVRRGAAADVFAASGADAMLARGGWRNVRSAWPYVSGDEISAGLLAQGIIDDSGPES